MIRELTHEQETIIEFIRVGEGNLLIGALAGSGKTSTLIESLKHAPQKSVLMCAFNKKIAGELTLRMPPCPRGSFWKAMTFHALGLKIVQTHGRFDIKPEATEELVNVATQTLHEAADDEPFKASFQMRRAAVRLLRILKETRTEQHLAITEIINEGLTHDVFGKIDSSQFNATAKIVQLAYKNGLDLKARGSIDFCDMVWLPVVLDLEPSVRYQAVYVDEAQDLSLPQFSLIRKLVAPNGRLIAVGDLSQSIYQWRGAMGETVWKTMKEELGAVELPLTTTFRCSRAVVKAANTIVPELKARDEAPEGSVSEISFGDLAETLKRDRVESFVLSRDNANLLHTAMHLWRSRIAFELTAGKEIVDPLFDIIDRLSRRGDALESKASFRIALTTWATAEMAMAEKTHASAWADRIEQQEAMLKMMLDYAEPRAFRDVLTSIAAGESSRLTLSTVHKVKGLEASRVYLLKQTFAYYRISAQLEIEVDAWRRERLRERLRSIPPEESNLLYVAITRAKLDLIWVKMSGGVGLLTGAR